MLIAMQVYIEYALLENFCMDAALLCAAKRIAKHPSSFVHLCLSSLFGAIIAVLIPVVPFPPWTQWIVKLLSGAILCLTVGKFYSFRHYAVFTATFFALTFLLGGTLFALYLSGSQWVELGNNMFYLSIPVGIPLFLVLLLCMIAKVIYQKIAPKIVKSQVKLIIEYKHAQVEAVGFFDSGNSVSVWGEPVSIIPRSLAVQLQVQSDQSIKVQTITGEEQIKFFTADKILIYCSDRVRIIKQAKLAIGPSTLTSVVLHPDLSTA